MSYEKKKEKFQVVRWCDTLKEKKKSTLYTKVTHIIASRSLMFYTEDEILHWHKSG